MKDGTASQTARSVAAHRLEFDRLAADYGDPAADRSLMADVADGQQATPGRMHDYLRARTDFFDQTVVGALDRGVRQVVIGGAGYDGRAFRYARPGVRWFELDHPATQADKRARLARLGLQPGQVQFVTADFTADPIAAPLLAAGLDPARPTLFLLEGVAVYLERPVVERVLAAFREVAADGSELAISVSGTTSSPEARARFEQRVAALGEPARSRFTPDEAGQLLAATGWRAVAGPERRTSAGLLLARTDADTGADAGAGAGRSGAGPDADADARPVAPVPLPADPPRSALPLPALLSSALVAFTIEADNEAEHRLPHVTTREGRSPGAPAGAPWLTSLLMWANCLRHLPDDGITVAELRRRARTNTNLDGMRRWGYVTYTPGQGAGGNGKGKGKGRGNGNRPDDDALVTPTAAGRRARAVWQAATEETEARWRARFGPAAIDRLRAALADVVARLDPALPDCLPVLGYGLRSAPRPERSGAAPPAPAASPAPAAPPARSGPAGQPDPAELPLWALLSRVLLAFALQYEAAEAGPSLAVSATVLRALTPDGVRTSDLPAEAGVSKEAVSMAVGLLAEAGLAAEGPDPGGGRLKVTRLTPAGVAARDRYPVLAAEVEADWAARLGPDRVAAVRSALEPLVAGDPPPVLAGLEPYPDNWRARVRPPRLLPHYPLTLHRGGFPDGA